MKIKTYPIHVMCRRWWAAGWTASSTFAYNAIAIVVIARRRWWGCCRSEQTKHLFRTDWPFFVNIAIATKIKIRSSNNKRARAIAHTIEELYTKRESEREKFVISLFSLEDISWLLLHTTQHKNKEDKMKPKRKPYTVLTHAVMTLHLPKMNWSQCRLGLASMYLYSVCEMMRNPNTLHDLGANRLSVCTNGNMTTWHCEEVRFGGGCCGNVNFCFKNGKTSRFYLIRLANSKTYGFCCG